MSRENRYRMGDCDEVVGGSGRLSLDYWDYNTVEELESLHSQGGHSQEELLDLEGPYAGDLEIDNMDDLLESHGILLHDDGGEAEQRNRKLEECIKWQQAVMQDQDLKIEFLTNQNKVMKEVQESRSRVYEQLEHSLTTLEQTNCRLREENANDKDKIARLTESLGTAELRIDELERLEERRKEKDEEAEGKEVEMLERKESIIHLGDESRQQIIRNKEKKESLVREVAAELELAEVRQMLEALQAEQEEGRRRLQQLQEQVEDLLHENRRLARRQGVTQPGSSVEEELRGVQGARPNEEDNKESINTFQDEKSEVIDEIHLNFSDDEKFVEDDAANLPNSRQKEYNSVVAGNTLNDYTNCEEKELAIKGDYKRIFANIFNLIEKVKEYER